MEITAALWKFKEPVLFTKPARQVDSVFIHCSASDIKSHDDVSIIRRWHTDPKPYGNGWSDVGYHYFITKTGDIQKGRDIERIPAAQAGYNQGSIAICLHGLLVEKFTESQFISLRALCLAMQNRYDQEAGDRLRFRGHCEVSEKACPVFDYQSVLDLDSQGRISPKQIMPLVPSHDKISLQLFDRCAGVTHLQSQLNRGLSAKGLLNKRLVLDGSFGRATQAAVRQWQIAVGLPVDGIAGYDTKQSLFDFFKKEV